MIRRPDGTLLRCIGAGVLAVALLWHAPSRADALDALLAAKRCAVVDRLRQIRASSDKDDRYLILSRADKPQEYVQCAFDDHDHSMLCEAASGYFFDEPRTMHLAPTAIAALGRLGFSTDDSAPENFRQTFAVPDPPDLDAIATLMLEALFVGYAVQADTALTFDAPDAPRAMARCEGAG